MQKLLITLLTFIIISTTASAQFYFSAGGGYAIPFAGGTSSGIANYNSSVTLSPSTSLPTSVTLNQASFLTGVFTSIKAGYFFSNHLAIQLDGNLGILNTKFNYNEIHAQSGVSAPAGLTISRQAKNPLLLIPSIVISTDETALNFYCRLGIALPVINHISREDISSFTLGTQQQTEDIKYTEKNRFSIGVLAAAGIKYKLSEQVNIWAEVSSLSLSMYIKEADITSYTLNGVPTSNSLHNQYYIKNGSLTSSNPSYLQPYSNLGISAGLSFTLNMTDKSERIYQGKKAGIDYEEK